MAKLAPHLRFEGNCKEALNFYKEILGGTVTLMTVGESPMGKDFPPEKQGLIMHGMLESGRMSLSGSDMMRDKRVVGDNVVLAVDCDSEEELRNLFAKLKEGGEVFMEPEDSFWGAIFGMTTDKYGFEWMLNYQKNKK